METHRSEKYAFVGEWYDSQASLVRRFTVFYYPSDNTIEMYDQKNKKTFMRRLPVEGISLNNFFVGCTLHIFGRLLKIVDYGNEYTKSKLHKDLQTTFILIQPIPINILGKILTIYYNNGLRLIKMKKTRLTPDDVSVIFHDLVGSASYTYVAEYLSSDYVYGCQFMGKNVLEVVAKVTGHNDPKKAEPGTIRALYGQDTIKNCVHFAANEERANIETKFFFESPHLTLTECLSNCTLCIIKPHAIREGKLGSIIEAIDAGGFEVSALNMTVVENVNAAEFYEVYKGIVPEYKGMMEELSSGACVAMEIVAKDKTLCSAVEFRKLVGPGDPEIARLIRPHTLRAKFGVTKVQNAVHCSDLPEDGLLEVEYFFKILV